MDEQQKLLKKCLKQQIDEYEMLTSIFSNPGELWIDDRSRLIDISDYVDGKTETISHRLQYSINFRSKDIRLEILIDLPHLYPDIEIASVTVRSTNRMIDSTFKLLLTDYIDQLDRSDVYIYNVVTWIQENVDTIQDKSNVTDQTICNQSDKLMMERLWIYSHHLKSTQKRHDIIKRAKELDLSGFSLPGKPGIICVEGIAENTQTFWTIIRSWCWHKITVRKREQKLKSADRSIEFRKFTGFTEMLFTNEIDGGQGKDEVRMNMSLFMKFLDQHSSTYMKKELFGFE